MHYDDLCVDKSHYHMSHMTNTAQDHALKVGMLQDMIDVIDLEKKLSGSETQGVAECCSVLQSVAVCCRVLQCVAFVSYVLRLVVCVLCYMREDLRVVCL